MDKKLAPPANIKERNQWSIRDFATRQLTRDIQGTKLQALYKLIQMKGEPIKSEDAKLNGVMALRFSERELIAIKKTPIKPDSFYPCMMQTYILTLLI